jgi:hypothetical protein
MLIFVEKFHGKVHVGRIILILRVRRYVGRRGGKWK